MFRGNACPPVGKGHDCQPLLGPGLLLPLAPFGQKPSLWTWRPLGKVRQAEEEFAGHVPSNPSHFIWTQLCLAPYCPPWDPICAPPMSPATEQEEKRGGITARAGPSLGTGLLQSHSSQHMDDPSSPVSTPLRRATRSFLLMFLSHLHPPGVSQHPWKTLFAVSAEESKQRLANQGHVIWLHTGLTHAGLSGAHVALQRSKACL